MKSANKKSRQPDTIKHLWSIGVDHRDWIATANAYDGKVRMSHSDLFLVVSLPREKPIEIEQAITKARALFRSQKRKYGMPTIKSVEYQGFVDKD